MKQQKMRSGLKCPRISDKKCASNNDCDQNFGGECRTSDGVCLEE